MPKKDDGWFRQLFSHRDTYRDNDAVITIFLQENYNFITFLYTIN